MKVCPFCSQPLEDSATQCTRCGRSQIFNEDDRPALGWPGCLLFGTTLVLSIVGLALLMGLLFGWMPRALNSTWGGSALLLLLMALAGHRLRRYLESRQAQTREGEGAPQVEILSPDGEPAPLPHPEREEKPRED